MGFIRFFSETKRKTDAALLVQNIIARNAQLIAPELDAPKLANRMVAEVWDDATALFDGRMGVKPHKIALAAAALAHALEHRRLTFEVEFAAINGIAAILRAADSVRTSRELSKIDHTILQACAATMVNYIEAQGIGTDDLQQT